MKLATAGEFDYGNTRLRARRARLLDGSHYERLLRADLPTVIAAAEEAASGHDARSGREAAADLAGLHEAIRTGLGRALEQMRSFYGGRARRLVDLLLSPFDTHNVVAVLRAAHREALNPAVGIPAPLLPLGWLTGPVAAEALRQKEPAAAIDLLVASTPHPDQARTLRAAFRDYERTQNLADLERAVVAEQAARVSASLARAGPETATVQRMTQRRVDEHNLITTLRLRAAQTAGTAGSDTIGAVLLPGGSLALARFASLLQAPSSGAVVAAAGPWAGAGWHGPLRRWAVDRDLHALHRELERATLADTMALFARGNPLTVDIPFAFSAAVQAQARNLRLIAEAAAHRLGPEVLRRELIWPQEQTCPVD
jgi:vacuolar-type H+-ATPase subunit C/Vma6